MPSGLENFDRPRRQLVLWSAGLLFVTLIDVRLGTITDAPLEGVASVLRLVENPRVVPACLSLVVLYFCFRLFVVWWQIPDNTRTKTGWPLAIDFYAAVSIACLSLVAFVIFNSGYLRATSGTIIPMTSAVAGLALVVILTSILYALVQSTRATILFGSILLLVVIIGTLMWWWKVLIATENEYRAAAAASTRATAAVLERLAGDDDESVRHAVAGNRSTPPAILERLADGDNEASIRRTATEALVDVYSATLDTLTRHGTPLAWVETQTKRGDLLRNIARVEGGAAPLEAAVNAYEDALTAATRQEMPVVWADTQNRRGLALRALGGAGRKRGISGGRDRRLL